MQINLEILNEYFLVIDPGATYLKGVLFKSGPIIGNVIEKCEVAPMPPVSHLLSSEDEKEVKKTDGQEEEHDFGEVLDQLARYIQEFAETHFPGVHNILLSFPMSHCYIRDLELPHASPAELLAMIPFEVEGLLHINLEEASVLGVLNDALSQGYHRAVTFSALHRSIHEVCAPFLREPFSLRMVTPESAAIATLTRLMEEESWRGREIIQIDTGGMGTRFNLLSNGKLYFTRNIPMGGAQITGAMARILKVTEELAEKIKLDLDWNLYSTDSLPIEYENMEGDSLRISSKKILELKKAIENEVTQWIGEIRRSIFVLEDREAEAIYLSGGGSLFPGLKERLEDELKIPVHFYPLSVQQKDRSDFAPWATAVGVMEHRRNSSGERLDFLTTTYGKTLPTGKFQILSLRNALAISSIAFVFFLASFLMGMVRDKNRIDEYRTLIRSTASTIPGIKPMGDPMKQVSKICRQRTSSSSYAGGGNGILDMLEKITEATPGSEKISLRFRRFQYTGKDIEIELEMDKLSDVAELDKALHAMKDFKDLTVKSESHSNNRISVKIKMTPTGGGYSATAKECR